MSESVCVDCHGTKLTGTSSMSLGFNDHLFRAFIVISLSVLVLGCTVSHG